MIGVPLKGTSWRGHWFCFWWHKLPLWACMLHSYVFSLWWCFLLWCSAFTLLGSRPTLFLWLLLVIMASASGISGPPKLLLHVHQHHILLCGKEVMSIAVVIESRTYLHYVSLRSPHLLTEKASSLDRFLFEHWSPRIVFFLIFNI